MKSSLLFFVFSVRLLPYSNARVPVRSFWRATPARTVGCFSQATSVDLPPMRGGGSSSVAKRSWKQVDLSRVSSSSSWLSGDSVRPLSRFLQQILYWATAWKSLMAVYCNESPRRMLVHIKNVVKVRPRTLYSIGALLRGLCLCTPLETIFDPCMGVGAGVNLCGLLADSQWVPVLILGFATSKAIWKLLGAKQTEGIPVPISISVMTKKAKKKK